MRQHHDNLNDKFLTCASKSNDDHFHLRIASHTTRFSQKHADWRNSPNFGSVMNYLHKRSKTICKCPEDFRYHLKTWMIFSTTLTSHKRHGVTNHQALRCFFVNWSGPKTLWCTNNDLRLWPCRKPPPPYAPGLRCPSYLYYRVFLWTMTLFHWKMHRNELFREEY